MAKEEETASKDDEDIDENNASDDGEDEAEGDEETAEAEPEKAEPKKAEPKKAEPKKPEPKKPEPKKPEPGESSGDAARHAASKPHSLAPTELPPPAAGLGKSVTAFFGVMVLLASGFWVLGSFDNPFGGGPPKWRIGQTVSVDLTLDPADDTKLACASEKEVAGKRCEYTAKGKRFEGKLEDGTMLRPYSLADNSARLLAAGVWSAPEVEKAVRPKDRFTLKCDFKVEGEIKAPSIRWDVVGAWNEKDESWYAGSVSNCKLVK